MCIIQRNGEESWKVRGLVERESIDRGNREASKLNLGQMSVVKVRASIAFAGLESILQIPWF
jgi:hypothetical protein